MTIFGLEIGLDFFISKVAAAQSKQIALKDWIGRVAGISVFSES